MMPTDVRDAMAASIRLTSCWPKLPLTDGPDAFSISASTSGLRDNTNPPTENPTMINGNSANTVKYVIPAAKKSPLDPW